MSWDADVPEWLPTSSDVVAYSWARYQQPISDTEAEARNQQRYRRLSHEMTGPMTRTAAAAPHGAGGQPPARSSTLGSFDTLAQGYLPSSQGAYASPSQQQAGWSVPAGQPAPRPRPRRNSLSAPQAPSSTTQPIRVQAGASIASVLPIVRQRLADQPLSRIVPLLTGLTPTWTSAQKGELVASLTERWSTDQAALLFMAFIPATAPTQAAVASPTMAQLDSYFCDAFARATPPSRLVHVLAKIPDATPLPVSIPSASPSTSAPAAYQTAQTGGVLTVERRYRMVQLSEVAHGSTMQSGSRPASMMARSGRSYLN